MSGIRKKNQKLDISISVLFILHCTFLWSGWLWSLFTGQWTKWTSSVIQLNIPVIPNASGFLHARRHSAWWINLWEFSGSNRYPRSFFSFPKNCFSQLCLYYFWCEYFSIFTAPAIASQRSLWNWWIQDYRKLVREKLATGEWTCVI